VTEVKVGRITDQTTFRALRRPAGRGVQGPVRVSYIPPSGAERAVFAEVGYAISKRCGNAVLRNRLRRRLRGAVRGLSTELSPGAYLLATAPEASDLTYPELVACVRDATRVAHDRARPRTPDA
jgi:ribonuclease P protein component